jgi:outer membrane protein OmpA-like peptidoglycan-associated protein
MKYLFILIVSVISINFYGQTAEDYVIKGDKKKTKKDYKGAIEDYTKAIELNPKYANAYLVRGWCKDELKDYNGAIQDYTKAIELNNILKQKDNPKTTGIYYFRGQVFLCRGNAKNKLGDRDGACMDWKKASELGEKEAKELINKNCNTTTITDTKYEAEDVLLIGNNTKALCKFITTKDGYRCSLQSSYFPNLTKNTSKATTTTSGIYGEVKFPKAGTSTIYLLKGNDTISKTVTTEGTYRRFEFPQATTSNDLVLFIKEQNGENKTSDILAKVLYGAKKDIPLTNNKVYLTGAKGDTLKTTETNEFGDFEFRKVNTENANIVVGMSDKIKNENQLYLANQNGNIIAIIMKTANSFTYRILYADVKKLSPIEEEDTDMKIDAFSKSADKTITVAENIYYPTNEYKVTPDIAQKLDIIVNSLTKNKTYKLEIYSHTDSKGDDYANLDLSNKRANAVLEYLVSKGIDKSRLTAKGMGETNIINRCTNGVNCSEKEHELNRRTEFKFIK